MNYTFEQIEPLIVQAEAEGSTMYCVFRLSPNSESVIESSAPIRRVNTTSNKIKIAVKRTVTSRARTEASRILRNVLGGGILGSMGATIFNTSTSGLSSNIRTDEDEKNAIVEAFKKVEKQFNFNNASQSWEKLVYNVPISALSEFEQQIKSNPINLRYEKEILARMLAEIIYADAQTKPEEIDFFNSVVPSEMGDFKRYKSFDPVSDIECEEINPSCKQTIYMLVWATALIDLDVHPNEKKKLLQYGNMMGLSQNEQNECIRKAKYYILEISINTDSDKSLLFQIARDIEMAEQDAERCMIQLKKRNG